jgi:Lar family restriction alleviation protein
MRKRKTYLQPCPECGENKRVVMVRGLRRMEYSCACYKCETFGPIARTRRGAVRKWNRFSVEKMQKTITGGPFTVIVKREESVC